MIITKDTLLAQHAKLKAEKARHLANAHATDGAMQAIEQLLKLAEQPEPAAEPEDSARKGAKR
jgi:hypothetical protein